MFTVYELLYALRKCNCSIKFKGLNTNVDLGYAYLSNGTCDITGCLDEMEFLELKVDSFIFMRDSKNPKIIVRVDE